MNRIDRYTSTLFIGYFIGALLVFVTMFLAIDAMSMLVQFKNVPSEVWARYFFYSAPDVMQKMLPVSLLLGTVLTLANLNKNNELVALFAAGMGLMRVARPLLILVLGFSAAGFVFNDRILPLATRQKNFLYYHEIKKEPTLFSTVKTDRIWYRSKNAIFNISTLSPDGKQAQGLTIYFFDQGWSLLQMLTAKDVELNGANWKLMNGTVTVFNAESSFPLTKNFNEKMILMGEDSKDLQSSGQTSDMLSQTELKRFIDKNKNAGLDTVRYEMDYHSKYGFALAGLVMSLLGIPFSVGRARSGGTMINVGVSIGLVFGYWVLYSSALTLGSHGSIPPVAAAWLPNIAMVGLAYYFLKRSRQ